MASSYPTNANEILGVSPFAVTSRTKAAKVRNANAMKVLSAEDVGPLLGQEIILSWDSQEISVEMIDVTQPGALVKGQFTHDLIPFGTLVPQELAKLVLRNLLTTSLVKLVGFAPFYAFHSQSVVKLHEVVISADALVNKVEVKQAADARKWLQDFIYVYCDAQVAAKAILDIYNGKVAAPQDLFESPEPCRAIAYHLGYEEMDGTPWWDEVMNIVSEN